MGKGGDSRATKETYMNTSKEQVRKMGTLNDCRNVIVNLITSSRCGNDMTCLSAQARAISEDIGKFKWSDLQIGTDRFYWAHSSSSFIRCDAFC